jgi:hypothetical protein
MEQRLGRNKALSPLSLLSRIGFERGFPIPLLTEAAATTNVLGQSWLREGADLCSLCPVVACGSRVIDLIGRIWAILVPELCVEISDKKVVSTSASTSRCIVGGYGGASPTGLQGGRWRRATPQAPSKSDTCSNMWRCLATTIHGHRVGLYGRR